jgi:hypothetical protein
MTIEEFCLANPYLYHLTSEENFDNIRSLNRILSTKEILDKVDIDDTRYDELLYQKRHDHTYVSLDGSMVMIRDQKPISIKALRRTLLDDWTAEQFLEHLNRRVFFWPSVDRLEIHYNKYQHENPKIIRVDSAQLIELNVERLKFCHLNSGATRCHPKWKGPPPRGANTFLSIEDVEYGPKGVAEVTFEDFVELPETLWVSRSPNGRWNEVK